MSGLKDMDREWFAHWYSSPLMEKGRGTQTAFWLSIAWPFLHYVVMCARHCTEQSRCKSPPTSTQRNQRSCWRNPWRAQQISSNHPERIHQGAKSNALGKHRWSLIIDSLLYPQLLDQNSRVTWTLSSAPEPDIYSLSKIKIFRNLLLL